MSLVPETAPAPVEADAIAAVVTGCQAVAELSGGGVRGAVATYLPGRRVSGVRATTEEIEVHVIVQPYATVPQLDQQVRTALAPLAHGRRIDVYVDDIAEPDGSLDIRYR